jgi:RNA polymerase sigma-70 factor (ECF subfamily)
MMGSAEDAKDMTQEVFLKFYISIRDNKAKWANEKAQAGWLCRVASNRCVDELRKRTNILSLDDHDGGADARYMEVRDDSPMPQDVVIKKETLENVQNAISKLSPMNRQAIVLRDCMELSYEEVARAMNLPMGTVKSRINRARDALKRILIQTEQLNAEAR